LSYKKIKKMETEVIIEGVKNAEMLKTIYERRSVRRYLDKAVDRELIEKVISAGCMAPSAMNRQPWKFYMLTNKETIKSFSKEIAKVTARELLKSGPLGIVKLAAGALSSIHLGDLLKGPDPIFYGAPVVIFITAPADNEWAPLDIGMCAQNIMLAAKSLGLESCPLGVGKYVEHTKIYYQLQVPFPEKVLLAIIIGYGNETPTAHARATDNVFYR
jgi:nitroreductase